MWPANTLCITIAANIAETGLLKYPMCFPDSVVGFNSFPNRSSNAFIHYLISFVRHSIQNSTSGSIQDNINIEFLNSLTFRIPASKTQENIVTILSCLDQKIELNNKIKHQLLSYAKVIYDYWFVQFDFLDHNGLPYKSSGGKMIFDEKVKKNIPSGWTFESLGEFEKDIVTGKTPTKKNDSNFNGDIPFIKIGDIRNKVYILETEEKLSDLGANSQPNKFIDFGDICVTCIASPGLVGIATEKSQTNQQINSIRCKNLNYRFYVFFALKDFFKISSAKIGNTFANMNKEDFCDIRIMVPNIEIMERYNHIVNPMFDKILNLEKQNLELKRQRDWLLPLLMNGQVTIKD